MDRTAARSDTLLRLTVPKGPVQNNAGGEKARRMLRPVTSIVVLAWAVRLASLYDMFNAILRYQPKFIYWLGEWVPFEISEGCRIRMFITSVLLFVLASGLQRGKRVAWQMTIAGLMIAPILHLGRAAVWPQALVNLVLIGFLLLHRRYFMARSDRGSIRSAMVVCSLMVMALLIFGTVRLHALHKQTSGDRSWAGCLQSASELVLVRKTQTQQALTPQTTELFSVLRIGGVTTALVGLVLILRPVLLRRKNATVEERGRVQKLVDRYGCDSLDPYAMLHDKSYFFTADSQVVVPYVLSGNIAVALANPIGPAELQQVGIAEFALFCRRQDWEPVFYAVTEQTIPFYEQAGLSVFKIGEGARLRTDKFELKGNDFQNLRTICNRARRLGIRFRWYDAAEGVDEVLERRLAFISQCWLETKKDQEMTFDMGSYSREDIRRYGAAVAVDAAGSPLAFATWRPFAQGEGQALDLMRALPQARNTMDFVLVESIARFRAKGVGEINLGIAPLANTQKTPSRLVAEEKVVQFLYENLNHVYGYQSLFEFKRKYRPEWLGRYVAYRRGVHLPFVGWALVRVHAPEGLWRFLFG